MSSGIDFTVSVFLYGNNTMTMCEAKQKIEDNNKSIEDSEKKLLMFASATPKDIIDIEWKEQPIDWLVNSTNYYFEVIHEAIQENVLLNLYVKFLEDKENETN
jgi:hypothetical protein